MDHVEIETVFGTARIVPANDGHFTIYVPWRERGGNFNPRLGTRIGVDNDLERCRKAIDVAVSLKQNRA